MQTGTELVFIGKQRTAAYFFTKAISNKKSLLKTMLNRAFHLSSNWKSFKSECDHLKVMFINLKYPDSLIKSSSSHFVISARSENHKVQAQSTNANAVHPVVLPFKVYMTDFFFYLLDKFSTM